jgi:4-hydroxybenzoate polyprenyltransferase
MGPDLMRAWVRLARPFTLLPPLLGIVSGAVCAFGSVHDPDPSRRLTGAVVLTVALGSLCASAMNAASNIVNQIADLEIDRRNKPDRPLVTGEISLRSAWALAAVLYVVTVLPTWLVVPYPYESFSARWYAPAPLHAAFFIYCLGALASLVYSFPALGRTKRHWLAANLTIAVTRGGLLKVAGWSFVASIFHLEAWAIGGIFAFFLLGATSTKDFSDMEGDRAHGCVTLPVRFGVARAARIMAPFFVLPWLLIPVFAWLPDPENRSHALLTGNRAVLTILGIVLAAWGAWTARLLLQRPEDLARTENHPAWTHMYLLLMAAQAGFALAYVI